MQNDGQSLELSNNIAFDHCPHTHASRTNLYSFLAHSSVSQKHPHLPAYLLYAADTNIP